MEKLRKRWRTLHFVLIIGNVGDGNFRPSFFIKSNISANTNIANRWLFTDRLQRKIMAIILYSQSYFGMFRGVVFSGHGVFIQLFPVFFLFFRWYDSHRHETWPRRVSHKTTSSRCRPSLCPHRRLQLSSTRQGAALSRQMAPLAVSRPLWHLPQLWFYVPTDNQTQYNTGPSRNNVGLCLCRVSLDRMWVENKRCMWWW